MTVSTDVDGSEVIVTARCELAVVLEGETASDWARFESHDAHLIMASTPCRPIED